MKSAQVNPKRSCIQSFNISGKSYEVVEVTAPKTLRNMLDNGLSDLYRNVFGAPPYNEVFAKGEVNDIFFDYLNKNGHIFILTHFETQKPLAFMIGNSAGSKFDDVLNMQTYIYGSKTAYLADDGVDISLRRKGVSTFLKGVFLEACREDGFEQVLLRTRADNYSQISAVNKAQGSIISGVDQYVARNIQSGERVQEHNKFFLFSFLDNAKPTTQLIEDATVVRNGGKDIIVVPEILGSKLTEKEILDAYPAASAVSTDQKLKNSARQLIFSGNMYVTKLTI